MLIFAVLTIDVLQDIQRKNKQIIKKAQKNLIKSLKKEGRMKKTEKNIMWGKLTKK